MLSIEQSKKIEERILITVKTFSKNSNMTIDELAELLKSQGVKTSSSTVQRDLNSQFFIKTFGEDMVERVKKQLIKNKENGVKKGGVNSMKNNVFVKDENGKFQGSRSR